MFSQSAIDDHEYMAGKMKHGETCNCFNCAMRKGLYTLDT